MGTVLIHPLDNVLVSLEDGHKYARRSIGAGEPVIKYGFPIGTATRDISESEKVHSHNLKTSLGGVKEYTYSGNVTYTPAGEPPTIQAYVRPDGDIGIRNDIWIIPTVGCVNKVAEAIAARTGAFAFTHPYGCSQLGGDHERTQKILAGLVRHPNAGGVLVLGLGCENNNLSEFKKVLGEVNPTRVRFLNCQDVTDDIAEGTAVVRELQSVAAGDVRQPVSAARLKIGMKCGGSDGFSGITANPLCGRITDRFTDMGGSAVLTEVPEMFGAEQILFDRCVSEDIFRRAVRLINDFKEYFIAHGEPVSENPSPGNKEGGITTLEEKSLGCVQKGGSAPVTDILNDGDRLTKPGLSLLNGPGNDIVAITNLTAAGCHIILFTTGRGTPLGAPVPTVKIATNTKLAENKPSWIDFDAQSADENALTELILRVAEGEPAANERNGYREIAIMKDGVTL